jgi:hypothetical protein
MNASSERGYREPGIPFFILKVPLFSKGSVRQEYLQSFTNAPICGGKVTRLCDEQ